MKTKKIITGTAQGLLSISLFMSGIIKITTPYDELVVQMSWAELVPPFIVILIGTLEILGVIGMNLPFILKKYKKIVPIAAAGLVLTMLGAVVTHMAIGENFMAALVMLIIASYVTYSRFELLRTNDYQTEIK